MRAWVAGWTAAVAVLAPFATVALPFRQSLYVRAGLVVAAVAALAIAAGTAAGWWDRLRSAPLPLLAGVTCYGAAVSLGIATAVALGNDHTLVAGQMLSMALLPATAVAGLSLPTVRRWFTAGLVASVGVGCWAQIAWWMWSLAQGRLEDRLFLPNSVSVVGPALMALLIALAETTQPNRRRRLVAWVVVLSAGIVIAGAAVRGLWLIAPLALLLQLVLWKGVRWRGWLRLAAVAVVAVSVAVSGSLLLDRRISASRPNLLPESPAATFGDEPRRVGDGLAGIASHEAGGIDLTLLGRRPGGVRSPPFEVGGSGSYVLQARLEGRGAGQALLMLRWLDARGRSLGMVSEAVSAGGGEHRLRKVAVAPAGTHAGVFIWRGKEGAEGQWSLDRLSLVRVGGPVLGQIVRQRDLWLRRLGSLVTVLRGDGPGRDPAMRFRWVESVRLVEAFRAASWPRRLLGHGLGASVHLGVFGFDNRGNWVWYGDVNYVHNFYLFLLYKLGLVGTLLVLGALLLWVSWTVRRAIAASAVQERAFLAAAAAAWVGYCVWSVTSPEILDFRMAPLWGLLIAATAEVGQGLKVEG